MRCKQRTIKGNREFNIYNADSSSPRSEFQLSAEQLATVIDAEACTNNLIGRNQLSCCPKDVIILSLTLR